jgi:hypothetical protein
MSNAAIARDLSHATIFAMPIPTRPDEMLVDERLLIGDAQDCGAPMLPTRVFTFIVTAAREIRVVRPGGRVIFHTPNELGYTTLLALVTPEFAKERLVQLFEGRPKEDRFRTYYRVDSERKAGDELYPVASFVARRQERQGASCG